MHPMQKKHSNQQRFEQNMPFPSEGGHAHVGWHI